MSNIHFFSIFSVQMFGVCRRGNALRGGRTMQAARTPDLPLEQPELAEHGDEFGALACEAVAQRGAGRDLR